MGLFRQNFMSTQKQIDYANALLAKHEAQGTLEDAIADLSPDLREEEDIADWFKRISVSEMSEVISSLKDSLEP
jgi:hypothetical protein